ncbi:Hypothetical protein PHPALM_20052 [Phytophthora palmivora]|uniref:Uncharacterized protein n=1 Tax=Phytophthora palmivora TaxID=4796 RepID=A0A2P4XFU1_9STRA|nr:Hypothetical protein PHPALM_20052 [Phytophthora palmivora]
MIGKDVPQPKLTDDKEEYMRWKSEVTLRFPSLMLSDITYGNERLRDMFKIDELKDQMEAPSLLWGRITAHFTKGDGVNHDYILRDVVNHELKPGQTVDAYVKRSEELVRRLREATGNLEEWEHASILLSNSQQVFREVTEQNTLWCRKNERRTLTRAEVTRRLRQAEQARSQVDGLQAALPVQRAAQTVNFVNKAAGK